MSWFYYAGRVGMKILLHLLTDYQVRGRENVPGRGPVLVVANHLNMADPPLLGVSLGRRTVFMAKEELFRSRLSGYFIRSFGAFPVHRGRIPVKAFRQASEALAGGLALVMFPEGARSKDARLQRAYPGPALIAFDNNVPVLPVGITGTEKIAGKSWILRRPRIMVNIGRAFYPPPNSNKMTKEELSHFTDSIMEHIAELLPPEYRGNDTGKEN